MLLALEASSDLEVFLRWLRNAGCIGLSRASVKWEESTSCCRKQHVGEDHSFSAVCFRDCVCILSAGSRCGVESSTSHLSSRAIS